MAVKVATRKVRGKDYEIHFNDRSGKFSAQIENDWYEGGTIDELVKTLTKATKKVVAIDFWRWKEKADESWPNKGTIPAHLEHGLITGKHAANGNLMVRFDGNKSSSQEQRWNKRDYLRLSEAEQTEYTAMKQEYAALKVKVEAFEEAHKIDTDKEIEGGDEEE